MDETPPTKSPRLVGQRLERFLVVDVDVVLCRWMMFSSILKLGLLQAGGIGHCCRASRGNQQAQHQRVPVKHLAFVVLCVLDYASRVEMGLAPFRVLYSRNESKTDEAKST